MNRHLITAWGVLRLPAAIVLCYVLREPIIDIVEQIFDVVRVTFLVIEVASTPFARLVLALVLTCLLLVLARAVARVSANARYWILLACGIVLFGALFHFTTTSPRLAGLLLLFYAANLVPLSWIDGTPGRAQWMDRVMVFAVGAAEALTFRRYIAWLAREAGWRRVADWAHSDRVSTLLPAFLLVSVAAAVLLKSTYLVGFEQWARSSPAVQVIHKGDFNWIELDESGRFLFVAGHGVPRLRRYDLWKQELSYIEADVDTGAGQSFAYDPEARELYVYHEGEQQLIYLDADRLTTKRVVPITELSRGDAWIVVDRETDTLTLVSEEDRRTGYSFLVLRRADGAVLDRRHEDAGNVIRHFQEPLLYLSYFRRSNQVKAYDLRSLQIVAETRSDKRVDRMLVHERTGELLVTSPLKSEIVRYDASALAELGRWKSIFGIRVLALDQARNLLLGGSLATGQLAVIDASTGRVLDTHYLGPWLRTIAVNPANGVAYVSSNGSLYAVHFGSERRFSRR